MASVDNQTPLIVITGPTASGKTALALELAERYDGEIICADSRTVYRGMDIGTAKPTTEDRARVPHHLLDVVDPGERFTVHDFQKQALRAVHDIRNRGKIPFLVGGTGLYIDSVVLEYDFTRDEYEQRQQLNREPVEYLSSLLLEKGIPLPENRHNKRHLIHALIHQGKGTNKRTSPGENIVVVAIATDKKMLIERITERTNSMFAAGVIDEAKSLAKLYGWSSEAMTGNIYRLAKQVIGGELSEEEARKTCNIRDTQLVKRQLTWLKRHDFVKWYSLDEGREYIEQLLADRTKLTS